MAASARWVSAHLRDLTGDMCPPSPRFRGGQRAADRALDALTIDGYADRRNVVLPESNRGASALSPYIRHGLLSLPRVWHAIEGGRARDVAKYRDELLWQEYARHLYARLGTRTGHPLRYAVPEAGPGHAKEPWRRTMACLDRPLRELERDGWLVNQTRMWLASQWTVREAGAWRAGEDHFFRELLDGSRAANRLGWQWTIGAATGKPYGFARAQVEKRAPALCRDCGLRSDCPIEAFPPIEASRELAAQEASLGSVEPASTGSGPAAVESSGRPTAVWLTAESMGDQDPALAAHPDLPAIFVFDAPRLLRWRLSTKRLVFLVETLADLATRRPVEIWRGTPDDVLSGRNLAATWTPVPGWRRLARGLALQEVHPWPWLRRPHAGSIRSYSAWRKKAEPRRSR